MNEVRYQAVTGVTPPLAGEALIREVCPSITAYPAIATLGRKLISSFIAAPLGWMLMLPFYFAKVLPFAARRYTLTNRRLMVLHGWKECTAPHMSANTAQPTGQVALADIDDVKIVTDDNSRFFRAGNLQIMRQGNVVLTLDGVPEPEGFRQCILNSKAAWSPAKPTALPAVAAAS